MSTSRTHAHTQSLPECYIKTICPKTRTEVIIKLLKVKINGTVEGVPTECNVKNFVNIFPQPNDCGDSPKCYHSPKCYLKATYIKGRKIRDRARRQK